MKIRIVHICHSLQVGGITSLVKNLIEHTTSDISSHEILVITKCDSVFRNAKPFALHFRWPSFLSKSRISMDFLKNFDVFCVHAAHPVVVAPLFFIGRHKVLLFQHGMTASHGSRLKRYVTKLWYSAIPAVLGARIVCSTRVAREKLRSLGIKVSDRRIVYLPFGVPISPSVTTWSTHGLRAHFKLGMAGRLVESKRFSQIIKSLQTFRPNHRFEFIIAGDGPERGRLQALAQTINDNRVAVHFLGELEHMGDFYKDLDLFIHPGVNESLGLVVLESLAHLTPVLVFRDVGGAVEIVVDGINGVVIDKIESIDRFWRSLDKDPRVLSRLKQNIRETDLKAIDIKTTRSELDRMAIAML